MDKKNNLLYGILVFVGVLLLLIPFLVSDLNGATTFFGHLARFGWHVAAFVVAIVGGSLFSVAVTKVANSSIVTIKAITIASAVAVSAGVTYNAIQYTQEKNTVAVSDTTSLASNDSVMAIETTPSELNSSTSDTISTETISSVENSKNENISVTAETKQTAAKANVTVSNEPIKKESKAPATEKAKPTETTTKTSTAKSETLGEQCNSFQVLQGNQLLDRKLGLSIYDPNKMIRFNNDCGCVLKDANMSVRRDGKVLEQKLQSGNYVNWRGFKDINTGDKLEIEIKQANCKDSKGLGFLYSFPKPILTIIFISDHQEYPGADSKNTKTTKAKEPVKTTQEKVIQKDKVEEEANKFGN